MFLKKIVTVKSIASLILISVVMSTAVFALTTVLAFRTPANGVSIPLGTTVTLTSGGNIQQFRRIRIVVKERTVSPTNARIILTMIDTNNAVVGQLDTITLTPGTEQTKVYEVPGTRLRITGQAAAGAGGPDVVDVFLFGSD